MPEYLAPGVYVEETSFRSKSIEGVSTTTTGFIGPCRYGPVDLENELITSVAEFERVYGDGTQLRYSNDMMHNYLWHAVRAFFEEGGKRLYVSRVFRPNSANDDGCAKESLGFAGQPPLVTVKARYPGDAGNMRVRFTLKLGQNLLGSDGARTTVGAVTHRDIVMVTTLETENLGKENETVKQKSTDFYLTEFNSALSPPDWVLKTSEGQTNPIELKTLKGKRDDAGIRHELRVLTVTVTVFPQSTAPLVWDGLALDKEHRRDGVADSLHAKFGLDPSNPARGRELPISIKIEDPVMAQLTDLVLTVLNTKEDPQTHKGGQANKALTNLQSTETERSHDVVLKDGNDGLRPTADHYQGKEHPDTMRKTGLVQFEDLEDISIVAAPGSTFGFNTSYTDHASTIVNLLISHATRMRYRIAVLDSGNGQSLGQVRSMRAKIDSSYAALYYPWVRVMDPITRSPIFLPPSGFVAGIYARNDTNRAVYKAPANEVVNLSIGFEVLLNKAQQDVLNPEGINAFRYFEGRGYRLWGARTVSSDPEWKYVNLRRYFAYLERSIDKGTQRAVFEPNGELLWANVRRTIDDFLLNEWQSGALLGEKPEKAYFVRCDRSTMTQNDLDNGRLICLIGVAPLRPAEFVIFRIGQWTADRKG